MTLTPTTPAGWYPQSDGSQRYWDGSAWTTHVAPAGAAYGIPALDPSVYAVPTLAPPVLAEPATDPQVAAAGLADAPAADAGTDVPVTALPVAPPLVTVVPAFDAAVTAVPDTAAPAAAVAGFDAPVAAVPATPAADGQPWPSLPAPARRYAVVPGFHFLTPSSGPARAVTPRSPGLALVASFLVPGLGQFVNGEVGKGICFLLSYLVGLVSILVVIGFVIAPVVWIWAMVDAWRTAQMWNRQHGILA